MRPEPSRLGGSVSETITPNAAPALRVSSASLPTQTPLQFPVRLHSHKIVPQSRWPCRAKLRSTIKRLLPKHGYPPDAQPAATELVIRQMETFAEEWSPASDL
jgi:hypothetical protein